MEGMVEIYLVLPDYFTSRSVGQTRAGSFDRSMIVTQYIMKKSGETPSFFIIRPSVLIVIKHKGKSLTITMYFEH